MTALEFINEFNVLFNNLSSNTAPPIDDYEKSVLLTKAQEDIILEFYTGKNIIGGFETSEEVREYIQNIQFAKEIPLGSSEDTKVWYVDIEELKKTDDYKDILFITREKLNINGKEYPVIPTSQDDIIKTLENPFKRPSIRRVLKVQEGNNIVLYTPKIANEGIYTIYGIRRPKPIILTNLNVEDLSIDGKYIYDNPDAVCELHPALHRAILTRAVLLAKQIYVGEVQQ